jgi:hypothetical protein
MYTLTWLNFPPGTLAVQTIEKVSCHVIISKKQQSSSAMPPVFFFMSLDQAWSIWLFEMFGVHWNVKFPAVLNLKLCPVIFPSIS